MKNINRRTFLEKAVKFTGLLTLSNVLPKKFLSYAMEPEVKSVLGVGKGENYGKITGLAVDALGGMGKFVKKGDKVVIKPNISWDRTPPLAANVHPEVLKEVIVMCLNAGAGKIIIFDRPCNDPRRSYKNSGAVDVAESFKTSQVSLIHVDDKDYIEKEHKDGKFIKKWNIYKEALENDVFISIAKAKHHGLSKLTLSMKNMMGVMGGDRAIMHQHIDQNLADLNFLVRPKLIILDAGRVVWRSGPQGGDISDTKKIDQVVASRDTVAIDSYGATFFDLTGNDLGYVKIGKEMGLGESDLTKVEMNIKK
ncbi:MAG: DUF362 domain-containing protein [bacterium]|nr:DUF362 domain-containing protein [bacterium]